ncbi:MULTISPECIES: DUF4845 domain-containing protein [Marinobacter]|uniref:DUF4845 domain-containing protein n=1 Tax=Marinobacter suaedae TaxID=3057675 RepID=A0ABT8W3Y8_9GAMM|nr:MULTISPECIES: DUF4845 domain-containing protein [unclassified Marinobacter]MBZ2167311.1 DUF4845 domain-containing protein [Marinobacter sp. F4216]MDO3722949.1 DUF4845 domain-containing protein [Marinobacter sp. chi1]
MNENKISGIGRQRGASGLTMMVMVLFFGGLLTLVIKLGPAYMDDYTIQQTLEGLEGTKGLSKMGPAQVHALINKRLSVNNVRTLEKEAITVEKNGELVALLVDYEVRTNLFRNVDAVVHFKHDYEMKGQ